HVSAVPVPSTHGRRRRRLKEGPEKGENVWDGWKGA
ncbi:hypothetical protein NPIL_492271, partial [Nephila pilipes]